MKRYSLEYLLLEDRKFLSMPGKRSRKHCWLLAIDAIHALGWLWSARAWHRQHQGPLGCGHPGLEARDVGC